MHSQQHLIVIVITPKHEHLDTNFLIRDTKPSKKAPKATEPKWKFNMFLRLLRTTRE